jgi:hypothetical protein
MRTNSSSKNHLSPALPEAVGVGSSEAQAPRADGLKADHDASRREDLLVFPQAEAEAVIQPDSLVDDFGRKTEAPVGLDGVLMPETLP